MKIHTKIFLLILFHVTPTELYSQANITSSLSKIIPASPEASAIALYQNYEIDPITGVPNVEVPLFDIDTKLGKIPFKLSYHIGRLKPGELTGPVGWGWTLTPNLGITRSIIGLKDEINGGYTANNPGFGSSDCFYNLSLARGFVDEQPDDFYYSLLSGGGRFLYRRDGTFSVPDKVKITRTANDLFQIVDVDGTIYKFGKYSSGTTAAIEKSGVGWPFVGPPTDVVSWKVTEIISYDKTDTIKFLYGPATTWNIQHYNAQVKFIEYPGHSEYQPQIYRTYYDGSGCTESPYIAHWGAIRMMVGGSSWPVASTDMYDVFDVNINEFNQGFTTWGYENSYCSPVLPTTCNWSDEVAYSTKTECYEYTPGSYYCYSYPVRTDLRKYVCPTGATYSTDGRDMPTDEVLQNNMVEELVLTGMVYRGGMVTLSYDSSRCKTITVSALTNGTYSPIKQIKIGQHPIAIVTSTVQYKTDYRNLLDSVTIGDANGVVRERYKFEYLSNNVMPLAINTSSDMFGFPDYGAMESMPKMGYKLDNYKWREINQVGAGSEWGSNRTGTMIATIGSKMLLPVEGSDNFMKTPPIAMLKRITYPTGGSANFEFERNRFVGPDPAKQYFGGGFRIKSIKYVDDFGKDSLVRSYTYGTNENGAGVVKFLPNVSDYMFQQTTDLVDPTAGITIRKLITTFNATPFHSMIFDNGAAVLYPEVTEYIGKPGAYGGKTVYSYFIGGLNNVHIPNSPVQENKRNEWMSKSLSNKRDYVFSNNAFSLIKKTQYSYTDFISDTLRCGAAYQKYFDEDDALVCSNQGVYSYRYDILPGTKKLTTVNDTLYSQLESNYLASQTNYVYDPSTLLLRNTVSQTSKGESSEEKIYYSNDVGTLTGWDAGQTSILNTMKANNRLAIPVKTEKFLNGSLKRSIASYFMVSSANNQIYPSSVLSANYADALQTDIQFMSYDSYGNVREQRKANDVTEVYIWGYNYRYPVARIIGADYASAVSFVNQNILQNPSTDQQLRDELQKIRTNLPAALVSTYTIKPSVGVTSETDPTGKTTYYEYDLSGRLKTVRDRNGKILKQIDYKYRTPITQ